MTGRPCKVSPLLPTNSRMSEHFHIGIMRIRAANLGFTIIANTLRIGDHLSECLGASNSVAEPQTVKQTLKTTALTQSAAVP